MGIASQGEDVGPAQGFPEESRTKYFVGTRFAINGDSLNFFSWGIARETFRDTVEVTGEPLIITRRLKDGDVEIPVVPVLLRKEGVDPTEPDLDKYLKLSVIDGLAGIVIYYNRDIDGIMKAEVRGFKTGIENLGPFDPDSKIDSPEVVAEI